MNVAHLRLKLIDFRAIGSADIVMDGITAMAGENGSGKSTISEVPAIQFYNLFSR